MKFLIDPVMQERAYKYHKLATCPFCGEQFEGPPTRTFCYKEECKEAKYQEGLQRDRDRRKIARQINEK